jgi:hypothetical protein
MEKVNNKELVKEEVSQVSEEELDQVGEDELGDREVKDAEIIPEETAEAPPPAPLIEQLKVHVKNLENKSILGYSILFSDAPAEGDDEPSEVKHGLATTYPAILNQILLGYHTNLISNEEVGFIEIIAHTISSRLEDLKANNQPIDEILVDDGTGKEDV